MRGGEVLKKYRLEKTARIADRLEKLQKCGDETLRQVSAVILDKLEFYDGCRKAWDDPPASYTPEQINLGKECCDAGINMADSIVNELRIMFLEKA